MQQIPGKITKSCELEKLIHKNDRIQMWRFAEQI